VRRQLLVLRIVTQPPKPVPAPPSTRPVIAGPSPPIRSRAADGSIWRIKHLDSGSGDGRAVPSAAASRVIVPTHERQGRRVTHAVCRVATPGVFGPAYFREIGDVLAASIGGSPDHAAIVQVMRRHGLTPAPPATG